MKEKQQSEWSVPRCFCRVQELSFVVLLALLSCWIVWPSQAADAAKQTAKAITLQVDLADGTRLVGRPSEQVIPFRNAYLTSAIPFTVIRQIYATKETGRYRVVMGNGDCIEGAISLANIKLETLVGVLNIRWSLVARVRAQQGSQVLPVTEGLALWLDPGDFSPDRWPDRSGNGADGVPKEVKIGAEGCPEFNGRDSVVLVPRKEALNQFTVGVWARKSNPKAEPTESVFSCGIDGDFYIDYEGVPADSTEWRVVLFSKGGQGCYGQNFVGHPFRETWTFFTAVYDGRILRTYADGKLCGQTMGWGGPGKSTDYYWLGRRQQERGAYRGYLGDVYLFKRALTGDEIERLFEYGRLRFPGAVGSN